MAGAPKTRQSSVFRFTLVAFLLGCITGILFERYSGHGLPEEGPGTVQVAASAQRKALTDDRIETEFKNIPREGLMVALAFGQSNAANYGEQRNPVLNENVFNFYSRKLYVATDPLLGATGKWGSVWARLENLRVYIERQLGINT